MCITFNRTDWYFWLSKNVYVKKTLKLFRMQDFKPAKLPMKNKNLLKNTLNPDNKQFIYIYWFIIG